jgi:hypothetical protein
MPRVTSPTWSNRRGRLRHQLSSTSISEREGDVAGDVDPVADAFPHEHDLAHLLSEQLGAGHGLARGGCMKSVWTAIVATAGLAALAVAAYELTTDDAEAAAAALVPVGALLLLSPLLLPRFERLKVTASGVELTLVREIARHDAPVTAALIQQSGLAPHVDAYATAHDELDDDHYKAARIHLQDRIIARAAATARRQKFDAGEVRALFADGSPTIRVLILGLMEGDPSLADADTIASAIRDSRSGNEQYHALRLAQLRWLRLTEDERAQLAKVIGEDPFVRDDTDRRRVAEQLVGPLSMATDVPRV